MRRILMCATLALFCGSTSAKTLPIQGYWGWDKNADGLEPASSTDYSMQFLDHGRVKLDSFGGLEGHEADARFRLSHGWLHFVRKAGETWGWPEPTVPLNDCAVSFSADRQVMTLTKCAIAGRWVRYTIPKAQ